MEMVLDIVSGVCLITGSVFAVIGGIGILRMPDLFSRMHAAGITDTLGAGLVLVGLMLQGGLSLVTVKLLLVFYFMMFTGPTAVHALARAAMHAKQQPLVDDREA